MITLKISPSLNASLGLRAGSTESRLPAADNASALTGAIVAGGAVGIETSLSSGHQIFVDLLGLRANVLVSAVSPV